MSFGEIVVVLVLALLVVGPQNLPKAARTLGRAYSWARHHMAVLQREVNLEIRRLEMKELEENLGRPQPAPPSPGPAYEEKAEAPAAAPARALSAAGNPPEPAADNSPPAAGDPEARS